MNVPRPSTIAVDFDGVIHGYSKGWHDGTIYDPPVPGAIDALCELMLDYAVFVHTSRDVGQVAGWLTGTAGLDAIADDGRAQFWNERGCLLVTNRKLPAVAYIVRTTYGPVTNEVVEHPSHARSFAGQLGALCDDVEGRAPAAQRAYEAYVTSCGGKSVRGDDLPGWDDQSPELRGHWEAAARAARG